MTDLTAQYRAKNGKAKFEIFAERDSVLYGRICINQNSNIWYSCKWVSGESSLSDYYNIEPIPVDHGLKVDDLVWVWNIGRHKKIRCFAKFVDNDLLCWADGESSKTPSARMENWGSDWKKYEPAAQELTAQHDDAWPKPYNREMTKIAAEHGLGHWRCVSRSSNAWWQRLDGQEIDMNDYANYDELKTWMDVLRYFDNKYPMTLKPQTEPKWHEYLKQGYMIVCEVWDSGDVNPVSTECIICIDDNGKYASGHEWNYARPVPSECGKFFTGIKDGKTHLLPI